MRNEKQIMKQNDAPAGINIILVCRIALLGVCVWCVCKIGVSVVSVVGIYILIRSVLKIIRLSIKVIFSLLSIIFLVAVIAIIIAFIL
ncbi:hypothetical protein [Dysgonomonas alginatilytica]|nr:hypothetical protein [Dysgonomonas alginatilytica]